MKKLVVIISFILVSCSTGKNDVQLKTGFWGAELKDESGSQNFVLFFTNDSNDINCQWHSYLNGAKYSSIPVTDIHFEGNDLTMSPNKEAGIIYEGSFNDAGNILEGKLVYRDGSELQLNFSKYRDEFIKSTYPGLAALKITKYEYNQPEFLDDGLETAKAVNNGFDESTIYEIIRNIRAGELGRINSLLVARNNKLIIEEYFDGFCRNDLHVINSATKSITSILIGIAIDKKLIVGIEDKVLNYLPQYKENINADWKEVILKDILTMSVGINWNPDLHDNIWIKSEDVIKTVLEQPIEHTPGSYFEYRNPNVDLLAGVLINSTGESVQQFASKNHFAPLGITQFNWKNFKNNNYPLTDGSLMLLPRDMLKIGYLVLHKGQWNNKRIVSEQWITDSTSPQIETNLKMKYGYLWWIIKSPSNPSIEASVAYGRGEQYIIVIPALDMVIVTTADNDDSHSYVLDMLETQLLPSIIK